MDGPARFLGRTPRLREQRHDGYFDVARFGAVRRLETYLDCVALLENLVPGGAAVDFGGGCVSLACASGSDAVADGTSALPACNDRLRVL